MFQQIKEPAMVRLSALLTPLVVVLGLGCAPPEQGSVFIEGVLPVGPDCSAKATAGAVPKAFVASTTLDIGTEGGNDGNSLTVAVQATTNLPATFSGQDIADDRQKSPNYPDYGGSDNNVITFTNSEVFFSTDADRDGEPALTQEGLPTTDANSRVTGLGGTVFNTQTTLSQATALFVTGATQEDAENLKKDKFVRAALGGDPTKRVRILLNIRVLGKTTGSGDVRSAPFPFPVDLCEGCLTQLPTCVDAAGNAVPPVANQTCFFGQDRPAFVCP
jgi:hypothetical protein